MTDSDRKWSVYGFDSFSACSDPEDPDSGCYPLGVPIIFHGLYDFPLLSLVAGYRGPWAFLFPLATLVVLAVGIGKAWRMAQALRAKQVRVVIATAVALVEEEPEQAGNEAT